MVRMTDLLKKAKKQLGLSSKESQLEGGEVSAPEKESISKTREHKEKVPPRERVDFSEMLLGPKKDALLEKEDISESIKKSVTDEEESKKLYFEAIEIVKKIFTLYKDNGTIDEDEILNTGRRIVNSVILGSQQLLKLFHELDSTEFYTYYNAVNVSTLSVEIGIAYNYNKSTLLDLAVVGLLHDMDLIKNKEIIDQPQKLEDHLIKEIRKHPLNVALYVDNAFKFSEKKVNAILQHHERKEGQGYPAGLTEEDIHDLAVIVGIADTYEAMTHSRPYKKRIPPHTAVLSIIEQGKELFPAEAIKALISRVSLYPVGSWIELNTGEICNVITTNLNAPLRPVVSVLMDKERNKFREIRVVDLRKIPSLYITKEVTEEIDIENK